MGGDGIILICPVRPWRTRRCGSSTPTAREGKMCGNGIRCVGKYLYDNGMVGGRTTITIDTLSAA